MAKDKLTEYWNEAAGLVLPFLADRKVAIELKFDDFSMYRRHPGDDKSRWIYIKTEADIIEWARKHAWSFHPHILGQEDWWFVVDVDGRGENMNLDITAQVAHLLAQILDEKKVKFLLKYSGNRGFHFMWKWDMSKVSLRGKDRWKLAKNVVSVLQAELNERLAEMPGLAKNFKGKAGCPFVVTNSQDKNCKDAILLDANILHEKGNIRSPFSVHLKTGLVSVPIQDYENLMKFDKAVAKQEAVLKQDWSWVEMPVNKWGILS